MKKEKISSPLLKRAHQIKTKAADIVDILDIGNDALLSRIHLIRSAQKSIDIQTFIWKKDDVGVKVLKELYDASRRGVRVRLLIDFWIFNEHNEVIRFLNVNHKNFEVKLYNPPIERLHTDFLNIIGKSLTDFKGINQRMHNKVFVVDDILAIVGGRNYDNMYYDRGETRNFLDLDLMVCGNVVEKIIKSFTLYWRHKLSVGCNNFVDIEHNSLKNCAELLDEESKNINKDIFHELDKQADNHGLIKKKFISGSYRCKNVDFVYDKPGKTRKKQKNKLSDAASSLQKILAKADESIHIQSPYFVLSKEAANLLKLMKKRNKELDIVVSTNSLAATDNLYAYAMLHKEKKLYIKDLGVRIFELKPVPQGFPDLVEKDLMSQNIKPKKRSLFSSDNQIQRESKFLCVHAKVFIIDDDLVWVGSFNADVRSEKLNTEVALIIEDRKLAKTMIERIKKITHPDNSWVVAPKKYVPVVTEINDELTSLSNALPFVDVWPFRNVTCFELRKNCEPVPIFHEEFYERYKSVGAFPEISAKLKEKEIKIRLLKTFGKIIKPVV